MMQDGIANMKDKVNKMQPEDWMMNAKSLAEFKPDMKDIPIKILDSLIDVEEKVNNGFSMYNRGQELKESLIDANRVRIFVELQERD
jgi:hypothetical protein